MKKLMSLIGSLMLLVGGFASADTQNPDTGAIKPDLKIKADIKVIKDIPVLGAMNCGGQDCSLSQAKINK